jgi:hypothetical protein
MDNGDHTHHDDHHLLTYYPTDQPHNHTTKKSPFLSLSLSFLDGGVTPLCLSSSDIFEKKHE